jgi:membrane-bound lytic murein transglycosylase B
MWGGHRWLVATVAGLAAAAASLGMGGAAPAGAQGTDPALAPPDGAGLLPGLDPRLVGAPLEYGASTASVRALEEARARVDRLLAEQLTLDAKRTELDQRLSFLDAVQRKAALDLQQAEAELRSLSAQVYTTGGGTALQAAALLETDDVLELGRVHALSDGYSDQLAAAKERAQRARQRASELAEAVALERVDVDARLAQLEGVDLPAAQRELELRRVAAAASLAGAVVAGLGIPLATLDAYLRAESIMVGSTPRCGIEWWMLAGIGRVESNHGRYGGAQPGQHGDVTPRIVGVPLDGSPGVAAIGDTDGGRWDGDPVWDRAVGPMQFIPSTWARYAADGNGDGVTDPNNVYDVALGAARYLCRAGGRLDGDAALTRAYLSYNHSNAYAASVLDGARRYQRIGLPALTPL